MWRNGGRSGVYSDPAGFRRRRIKYGIAPEPDGKTINTKMVFAGCAEAGPPGAGTGHGRGHPAVGRRVLAFSPVVHEISVSSREAMSFPPLLDTLPLSEHSSDSSRISDPTFLSLLKIGVWISNIDIVLDA